VETPEELASKNFIPYFAVQKRPMLFPNLFKKAGSFL